MARYFFHLLGPEKTVLRDEVGEEYSSLDDAQQDAIASIREILSYYALDGKGTSGRSLEITDEDGTVIKTIPYSAAVE